MVLVESSAAERHAPSTDFRLVTIKTFSLTIAAFSGWRETAAWLLLRRVLNKRCDLMLVNAVSPTRLNDIWIGSSISSFSDHCGRYGTCLNLPTNNSYKCQCRFFTWLINVKNVRLGIGFFPLDGTILCMFRKQPSYSNHRPPRDHRCVPIISTVIDSFQSTIQSLHETRFLHTMEWSSDFYALNRFKSGCGITAEIFIGICPFKTMTETKEGSNVLLSH